MAQRHDDLADLHLVRLGERQNGEPAAPRLHHGEIGRLVATEHVGLGGLAIVKPHAHAALASHDMGIGERVPVGREGDAGAVTAAIFQRDHSGRRTLDEFFELVREELERVHAAPPAGAGTSVGRAAHAARIAGINQASPATTMAAVTASPQA